MEQHKIENLREAEKRTVVKEDKKADTTPKKESQKLSREEEKALKKLKNKSSKIETKISDLEKEIEVLDLALAENYEETSSKPDFFENYKKKKKDLEDLMFAWEEVEEEINNFA